MSFEKLHSSLLQWYEAEGRDLPWRKNKDPYRIWLSEIMLQQTRVETVLPYYLRFLSHYPTIRDLAEAPIDQVTNLWAGLGYYSRARNLHAAAKQVVEDFGGKFPASFAELRQLKGVGPYTAAAVASIAFDENQCALDGNLERVFSRILALRENPKTSGRKTVLALGEGLVRLGQAGDVNQAVMDLASLICLPRNPRCTKCPVAAHCKAQKLGIQADIPLKAPKPEKLELKAAAWVVVTSKKLLLAKRPRGEWLAGMWDLPWKVLRDAETAPAPPFGSEVAKCAESRTITKHKIHFEVRALVCSRTPLPKDLRKIYADAEEFRWVNLEELHGIHLPRPSEKALNKLLPALN